LENVFWWYRGVLSVLSCHLNKYADITTYKKTEFRGEGKFRELKYGTQDAVKICKWIYYDSMLCSQNKYLKAQDLLNEWDIQYLLNNEKNQRFFDTWPEPMAYILGFIAADGNVSQSMKHLKIKLASKDIKLLSDIRDIIAPTVRIIEQPNTIVRKNSKEYPNVALCVGSKYICRRLVSLGIVPAKSLVLKFPDVPDGYANHFIRGYFDGTDV